MTQRSNSRRFVNAAWSLLTFQLIASAGAVAVTGYAAFRVPELVRGAQEMRGPVDAAVAVPEAPAATEAPATQAPTETVAPAPAAQAPADAAAVAPAAQATAPTANAGSGTLQLRSDDRGNLILTLTDPDGVANRPQLYWFRNGAQVQRFTGSTTYALTYDDSTAVITARADYVDGHGFRETVMSAPFQVGAIIQ